MEELIKAALTQCRLVWLLGNKWTEISQEFPEKSAAACRLHYMNLEKGYDSDKYRK